MIRIVFANAARVLADRKGVTAAEYAVLATGIVAVVALAATNLGTAISNKFGAIFTAAGGGT